MYRFLKNILFFSLFVLFVFAINYQINSFIINRNKKNFKLINSTVIFGDSHMVRAIDPKYYKNASNLSQNSEPYYISFLKIKELVKLNKIDTIILGCSFHNLSTFNDYKFHDEKWSKEMFNRSYAILDFSIFNNISVDYKMFFKTIVKNYCLYPKSDHLNYLGEFFNSNKTNFEDTETVINRHFFYNSERAEISSHELNYLQNIVDICSNNSIKLLLVASPLHKTYIDQVPKLFKNKFDETKVKYSTQDILFLDYSDAIYDDIEFLNSDHLNSKGAKRFSKMLYTKLHE